MNQLNRSRYVVFGLLCLLWACGGDDVQSYRVGGVVSGLNGTIEIRNNGVDKQTISVNGTYHFDMEIADGEKYSVSILELPDDQGCTVRNFEGTIQGADITNAHIDCF